MDGNTISSQQITRQCNNGVLSLDLNSLPAGSYQLIVTAHSAAGDIIAQTPTNFCARQCGGGMGGGSASLYFGNPIALGYGFKMRVPAGMHITEYSSSKTTGIMSTFRISPESDPFYLGNYACRFDFDRLTRRLSPAGAEFDYCHSTPTREIYKQMNEFRLANNHVEIASDADVMSQDGATPQGYQRLTVSVFDTDYEFMNSRSRFHNLCGNAPVRHVFQQLPMLNRFFLGQVPDRADFWSCNVKMSNALGGPVETWRVGAFFSIRGGSYVPTCSGPALCSYPEAVEMVFMALASPENATPEDFAQQAQGAILSTLERSIPNPN
jgi:hypothetical protein